MVFLIEIFIEFRNYQLEKIGSHFKHIRNIMNMLNMCIETIVIHRRCSPLIISAYHLFILQNMVVSIAIFIPYFKFKLFEKKETV